MGKGAIDLTPATASAAEPCSLNPRWFRTDHVKYQEVTGSEFNQGSTGTFTPSFTPGCSAMVTS